MKHFILLPHEGYLSDIIKKESFKPEDCFVLQNALEVEDMVDVEDLDEVDVVVVYEFTRREDESNDDSLYGKTLSYLNENNIEYREVELPKKEFFRSAQAGESTANPYQYTGQTSRWTGKVILPNMGSSS